MCRLGDHRIPDLWALFWHNAYCNQHVKLPQIVRGSFNVLDVLGMLP